MYSPLSRIRASGLTRKLVDINWSQKYISITELLRKRFIIPHRLPFHAITTSSLIFIDSLMSCLFVFPCRLINIKDILNSTIKAKTKYDYCLGMISICSVLRVSYTWLKISWWMTRICVPKHIWYWVSAHLQSTKHQQVIKTIFGLRSSKQLSWYYSNHFLTSK